MSKKKRETPAGRRHWRDDIVEALDREGAPLDADELASRMQVSRQDRRAFTAALADLAQSGEVVRNRAGAILVARKIALVAGKIEGHPDGFGFLAPDDGGADIYLPFVEMRKALHGDRATVRVTG